jgi:hypothetical protein
MMATIIHGPPGVLLWLALALGVVALVLEAHDRRARGLGCRPCGDDNHEGCRPVTPPDLPGERGCCCGQLVPL